MSEFELTIRIDYGVNSLRIGPEGLRRKATNYPYIIRDISWDDCVKVSLAWQSFPTPQLLIIGDQSKRIMSVRLPDTSESVRVFRAVKEFARSKLEEVGYPEPSKGSVLEKSGYPCRLCGEDKLVVFRWSCGCKSWSIAGLGCSVGRHGNCDFGDVLVHLRSEGPKQVHCAGHLNWLRGWVQNAGPSHQWWKQLVEEQSN